jgi:hypothetical protein
MKPRYTRIALALIVAALFTLTSCNRDERLMKKMEGNWTIEESIITYHFATGGEQVIEELSNTGRLVITEGNSDLEKSYDFFYINSQLDTIQANNQLVTDEYKSRMIMMEALIDTVNGNKPIVWTIEKQKRNKQVWTTFGVDSTLFYPSNNMNPNAAENWVSWTITLKRD